MIINKQTSTSKKLIQLIKIGAPICAIIGFCYTFLPKIWNQLSEGIWLSILGILILYLVIFVSHRFISKKRLLKKQEKDKELSIKKLKEHYKSIQETNESVPYRESSHFDDIP